jgi:hypothetical protein
MKKSHFQNSVFHCQRTRRNFLKSMKIAGLGAVGLSATSLLYPTLAQTVNRQDKWRWCNKCQVLHFAGGNSLGACAAGGLHNFEGSSNYSLILNTANLRGQYGWRWCNKCQELFFAGGGSKGVCPTGGKHNSTGSGDYLLKSKEDSPNYSGQAEWRWCRKCQALSFAGGDSLGACPAGGSHDNSGSGNYILQER